MKAKPKITFLTSSSNAVLSEITNVIIGAMGGNANFPTPTPSLSDLGNVSDTFTLAVGAAMNGGKVEIMARDAARASLVAMLRTLAAYVQLACNGDLSKLITSGFPAQRQPQPVGPLPVPGNLVLQNGANSGELKARVGAVYGTSSYNWRAATVAAPTVFVQTAQTSGANYLFTGLTPVTEYIVQANASGTAGPTDWTDGVTAVVV